MRNVSLSLIVVLLFATYSFADDFKIIKKALMIYPLKVKK